ncbi:type II secretion system F family protein [bacterium]|nr:type II secretion system F family protein [bacterium]
MKSKQYDLPALSLNDKIELFGAFSNYLDASIPLNTALFQMAEYTNNVQIRRIINLILKEGAAGVNFTDTILKFKKTLGAAYCNLISVGVQTGELPQILKDINDLLLRQREFKSTVIRSCSYPAFLLVLLILSVILLVCVIQPKLAAFTASMTGDASSLKIASFGMESFINISAIIGVISVALFFMSRNLIQSFTTEKGLKLPLFGAAIKYYNLSTFSRLLAISYKAGIPITQAIILSADAIPNTFMRDKFIKCSALVSQKPIAKLFGTTGLFPNDLIMKIESGDVSGNLDKVFFDISNTINLKLEMAITSILKLLEPTLLVLIGCAVGYFAYSVLSTVYGSLLAL